MTTRGGPAPDEDVRAACVPEDEISGEDAIDTQGLKDCAVQARAHVQSHSWCKEVVECRLGVGMGRIAAVFLVHLVPQRGFSDDWLWVLVGDLPAVHLVLDEAPTPDEALLAYCELMEDWIVAVRKKDPTAMKDVFPVPVPPTEGNATALETRVEMLRNSIHPQFKAIFERRRGRSR